MKLQGFFIFALSSRFVVEAISRHHPGSKANNEYLSQRTALLDEMKAATLTSRQNDKIMDAIQTLDPQNHQKGMAAWKFLKLLATSPQFISQFWQAKPLLLRSEEIIAITKDEYNINWADGSFTIERDLKLLDGSYISGSRTDDILREGIKTDTWAFRPIKDDPTRKTTWAEIADALKGGTIYFNSAGSFWPALGALCRLTNYAFGLPTNINIYITPPGSTVSVPPHTDRQDVIVFQTEGSKRWRVYNPPKRLKGKDPLNRGKAGDVIEKKELGNPLLDVILRRGDGKC